MLMVTNSIEVTMLDNFLLPITEEVRVCTSQRTLSACLMYYSKFDQDLSALIQELTKWSLTKT